MPYVRREAGKIVALCQAMQPGRVEEFLDDGHEDLTALDQQQNIADIKRVAAEVITARYPAWRQRNMTARALELVEVLATGGTLTRAEEQELGAIRAAWTWVKAVRAASDAAEAAGTPSDDVTWPA